MRVATVVSVVKVTRFVILKHIVRIKLQLVHVLLPVPLGKLIAIVQLQTTCFA